MRKGLWLGYGQVCKYLFAFFLSFVASISSAQQLTIRDFVLFGGNSNCSIPGQATTIPPGCGVQIGTSGSVIGGKIGSHTIIRTTGNAQIDADIISGGRLELSNTNTVNGTIAVGNTTPTNNTIFTAGSNFFVSNNVYVNGSSTISGGLLSGFLMHPSIASYSGPLPAGGEIVGTPPLPGLPVMPSISSFDPAGNGTIATSQVIVPDEYGALMLNGGKTITFSGTGTYVFSKIKNSGNANKFIFDFQNSPTGIIRINVHDDVDLYKINVELINGGSASRIFMEVHGNGSSSANGNYAWMITNGASGNNQSIWYGTVWAPYGGINVGSGSSPSKVEGALWSGTQVVLDNGVGITYAMPALCQAPNANAGPDKFTDCDHPTTQLNGSSATANVSFKWTAVNGNFSSTVPNPTVSAGGTYVLTVTDPQCYMVSTDTAIVTYTPCILPYYPPYTQGKVFDKIGSELSSLKDNFGNVADSAKAIFLIKSDTVLIDIISMAGQTAALKSLLMSPAYGLKDTISNGANSLIITGWFPINNLSLLNALASVNYCRPAFPAMNNSGIVSSQGDSAMRTGLVRNGYHLSGDSIKIGVLSDSYNTLAGNPAGTNVVNGDLPGAGNLVNSHPVQVLMDYPFGARTDEGRAMLQIVHDVAPKSKLAFRTGFLTPGDFAVGIRQLADSACDVIIDDITFITEPFFKPGVVETAIQDVTNAGVSYVTAAGNVGIKSYESVFQPEAPPAGITGRAHRFAPGDIFQNDSLKGSILQPGIYTIVLQWDDNIYSLAGTAGTTHDLDIYLTDDNGVTLFGFNRNNLGGDPLEVLPFTVTANTATNILIVDATADPALTTSTVRFKYVVFRGDLKINEHIAGNSTIVGQGNAPGAITVGASFYGFTPVYGTNPPVISSYSSKGGTPVNNVIRNKPDLVGPSGVNTTVNFGSIDYELDGRPNFFGTSAAAPHVGAAIALMKQAKRRYYNQNLSPADAKTLLTTTATDMDVAGFDFRTGYGFINVDSAMRSMANPTPQIISLELADSSLTPGAQPMDLIVHGNFFIPGTRVIFGTDTLNAVIQNSNTAVTTIPSFNDDVLVSVYNEPKSLLGTDGGSSDSISITGVVKKLVRIIADDKTKKYGEQLPSFTSTVLVDGDSLQHTALTLADLGLTNISYQTPADPFSQVDFYFIRPSRIFNPANAADAILLTKYNYVFEDGTLTVQKLPVTVTPLDTTLLYGQQLGNIQFSYEYDSALNIADPNLLLNKISSTHQSLLVNDVVGLVNGQAVVMVSGQAIPMVSGQAVTMVSGQAVTMVSGQQYNVVNGQALTIVSGQAIVDPNYTLPDSSVDNTSFMASEAAILNARQIVNQQVVNGTTVNVGTKVVDITAESILDFNQNPSVTELITSVSQTNTHGVVSASALINGQALTMVSGQALTIVSGQALTMVSGQAVVMVSGQAIPIVSSLNSTSNTTAVILDQNDTLPAGAQNLKSINMVTGLTSGVHSIIPGALLNDNLDISYRNGTMTILAAPITVKAKDSSKLFGQAVSLDSTRFSISSGALQFGESIASVTLNSAGTSATAPAGAYPIVPSAAVASAGTNLSNYNISYSNGTLNVGKVQLLVKAMDTSRIYGYPNPAFTASYSGFVNGETIATSGITGSPLLTTTAVPSSVTGTYPINASAGSLTSTNYTFSFSGGVLTINKAPLTVKADDKVIFAGDNPPAYTGTITGLRNGDLATYSYAAPTYSGSAGLYPIVPTQTSFPKAANYAITVINGTLYVNPKGAGAKKLRPYLDCVEEVVNPPAPNRQFIAHFYCENTNSTPVYVPIGNDNKLTSLGSFDGSGQPIIFMPGTTSFNVPFDGLKLTWELRTYETNKKTSVASDASSTSNKCNNVFTTSARSGAAGVENEVLTSQNLSVYPNPTKGSIKITGPSVFFDKSVEVFDATGRKYSVRTTGMIQGRSIEVDLSSLAEGVYFIKVKTLQGIQTVRILKTKP